MLVNSKCSRMDEIEKVVKNALSFIYIVQNSCDMQRQILETNYKEQYAKFVESSKSINVEELNESNPNGITATVVDVEGKLQELEIEELSQADKLLKKARKMREKYQQSLEGNTNISDLKKNQQKNRRSWISEIHISPQEGHSKDRSEMTNSSSEPLIHESKDKVNGEKVKTPSESICGTSTNGIIKASGLPRAKTYQSSTKASYIARKDYNSYRTIPTYTGYKNEDKSISISRKASSFKSEIRSQGISRNSKIPFPEMKSRYAVTITQEKPSNKDFQRNLQKKIWDEKVHRPKLLCLIWYPFLNSTNENRLALHVSYCDVKELRHVSTLLHNIQETLYWLDLLCLLGKNVAIVAQEKNNGNQQFALAYSCLRSIFCKDLQRTPIVLPLEPP